MGVPLAHQQAGDEEAGDDEEDVDADEAAARARNAGMEQQHRPDGDGPEALDVGAEVGLGLCVGHSVACGPAGARAPAMGSRAVAASAGCRARPSCGSAG